MAGACVAEKLGLPNAAVTLVEGTVGLADAGIMGAGWAMKSSRAWGPCQSRPETRQSTDLVDAILDHVA